MKKTIKEWIFNNLSTLAFGSTIVGLIITVLIFVVDVNSQNVLSLMVEFGPGLFLGGLFVLVFDLYREVDNEKKHDYSISQLHIILQQLSHSLIDFYVDINQIHYLVQKDIFNQFYRNELKYNFDEVKDMDDVRCYIDGELRNYSYELERFSAQYFSILTQEEIDDINNLISKSYVGHVWAKESNSEKKLYSQQFDALADTLNSLIKKYNPRKNKS